MKKISLPAVIVSGLADVVMSSIINGVFVAFWVISRSDPNVLQNGEKVAEAIKLSIKSDNVVWLITFCIGAAFSISAGYLAAWIAKRSPILNGAWSSWACVGMGVFSLIASKGEASQPFHMLSIPLSVLLGGIGGYLRSRQINAHL